MTPKQIRAATSADPGLQALMPVFAKIISKATPAVGSDFAVFDACECLFLVVENTSPGAVDIEVQREGSGPAVVVPAGASRPFYALLNANQIGVRRLDQSSTPTTVIAEALY